MKRIKVEIEETERTDLLCLRCGGFRAEYVVHGSDHVGVHKRCLREARPETARRRRTSSAAVESGSNERNDSSTVVDTAIVR